MNKLNNFIIDSIAYNIVEMSNEELQRLAQILSGSVGERLCDYLTFAIQDAQLTSKQIFENMETI